MPEGMTEGTLMVREPAERQLSSPREARPETGTWTPSARWVRSMTGKVVVARPAQVLVQEMVASSPAFQMVVAMGAPYLRSSAEATVMVKRRRRVVANSHPTTPNQRGTRIGTCIELHLDLKAREVEWVWMCDG